MAGGQSYYNFIETLDGPEIEALLLYLQNNKNAINGTITNTEVLSSDISNLKINFEGLEKDFDEIKEVCENITISKIDGGNY